MITDAPEVLINRLVEAVRTLESCECESHPCKHRQPYEDAKRELLIRLYPPARPSRRATSAEVIHHINGDPTDNRLENLLVRPRE